MRDPRSEVSLAEALSCCLERLENEPGLAPEDCVRDYPQHIEELSTLVEVAIPLRGGVDQEAVRRRVAASMSKISGASLESIFGNSSQGK